MALNGSTVLNGATISATGGTTITFGVSGKDVPNGVEIVDVGATDYTVRTSATFKVKMPNYNSVTGTWSKGKREIVLVKPKILASGALVFPLCRIDVEDHPEMSAAEALELRKEAAQLLTDSDFDLFFTTGSKA